jgi:hypothetical protein
MPGHKYQLHVSDSDQIVRLDCRNLTLRSSFKDSVLTIETDAAPSEKYQNGELIFVLKPGPAARHTRN